MAPGVTVWYLKGGSGEAPGPLLTLTLVFKMHICHPCIWVWWPGERSALRQEGRQIEVRGVLLVLFPGRPQPDRKALEPPFLFPVLPLLTSDPAAHWQCHPQNPKRHVCVGG